MRGDATFGGSNLIVVSKDFIEGLADSIKNLTEKVAVLTESPTTPFIYTNKSIKDLLGIQDKLLKKYRDDGLLGYHQIGDKYWYTREDVEQFLANAHYEAYAYAS